MAELRADELSPEVLLFDPNNFRFQDSPSFVMASESRFAEASVQERAFNRLRTEEKLVDLKRSIQRNGYMPVERIVVRPYEHSDGKFVVIEGNRRLAAVRWIIEEHEAGAEVPDAVLQSLDKLPVLVAEEEGPDEAFRASLMGIRHVSGIKEWGGYQRAKLIVDMRDELDLDAQETSERLALSTHEVNRRYRAFKALQQLQDDEEFGEHAVAGMYPLFHEAVSLPIVRDWLGWNEDGARFEHEENRRTFYNLITPSLNDEEEEQSPKITGYAQVRELRTILAKPESKRILLDPHRSLQDAITSAHQEELARAWASDVGAAITALESMGIEQVRDLNADERELLQRLSTLVEKRLRDHSLLAGEGRDGGG